jgi:hypothetical protein
MRTLIMLSLIILSSCACYGPLGVVERVEEDYVVIIHDSGSYVYAHVDSLPVGVGDGDVVNPDLSFNEKETARRRAEVEKLLNKLQNKQ